jgi:prepilin-type N-terminal cleavage/methylation domain-containing protein
MARGFSLVELLIALTICALISTAIASITVPARAAFERTPAVIDLHQRGRTALDAISQAIRSAGADVAASQDLGPLAEILPPVILADSNPDAGQFTRMLVVTPRPHAAQGVLRQDQGGPSGSLALTTAGCPEVQDVCGFLVDMPAVIADGTGRFDLFVVGYTDPMLQRLTPETGFGRAYPAGSILVEADALSFRLDGDTLVRETPAGAVQPVVDGVTAVYFRALEIDPDSLVDGPWWEGPDGPFDADWFTVRSVEVTVRLRMPNNEREHDFQTAVSLRNVR